MAAVDRFLIVAVGHCLMAAVGVFLPYVVDSLPRATARSFSCIGRSGVAGPTDDSSILPCDTTVYHLHGITSSDDGQPVYRVKRKQHHPHVIRSTHQARHTHAVHPPTRPTTAESRQARQQTTTENLTTRKCPGIQWMPGQSDQTGRIPPSMAQHHPVYAGAPESNAVPKGRNPRFTASHGRFEEHESSI